ncbi:transposase [Vibrio sp.]|uniref:transposase n=1 Tax=Vibrio sp. TaxID=678 RepID=UPI0031201418
MLGICYKKRAISVCWTLLEKKGNSNEKERIGLVSRFIRIFGTGRIDILLADREFVGGDWFRWLREHNIPFNIRIKKNTITTNSRGLDVDGLFYYLKPGEEQTLSGAHKLWDESVYLAGARLDDGELLIIATSAPWPDSIMIYAKLWEMGTLFECLKGRV